MSGDTSLLVSDFPTLAVARGDIVRPIYDHLRTLFFAEGIWKLLPDDCRTLEFRQTEFAVLSKAGCLTAQLLDSDRLSFPTQALSLVEFPEKAQEVCDAPACLLDEWTANLRYDHPGLDVENDVVLATKLIAALLRHRKDNYIAETGFATIRREVVACSTQCKRLSFEHLDTMWMSLQQRRKRALSYKAKHRVRDHDKRQQLKDVIPEPKRKKCRNKGKGGGGTWRAWMRKCLMGKKRRDVDFKQCAVQYKNLTRCELRELEPHGQAATRAYKRGARTALGSSFGVQPSKIRRKLELGLFAELTRELEKDGSPENTKRVYESVNHRDVDGLLTLTRCVARSKNASHRDALRDAAAQRKEYQEGKGAELADSVAKGLARGDHSVPFVAAPVSGAVPVVMPAVDVKEDAINSLSWASPHANCKKSTLCPALLSQSTWAHSMVEESTAPTLSKNAKPPPGRKCKLVGCHICAGEGLELSKRFGRLLEVSLGGGRG